MLTKILSLRRMLIFKFSVYIQPNITPMIKKILLLLTIVFFFSSCVPRKKITYVQNIADVQLGEVDYNTTLKNDDLLLISVNAPFPNQDLALPFQANVSSADNQTGDSPSSTGEGIEYQIDSEGKINMPIIGDVKVSGLKKNEAVELLKSKISLYIKDPVVSIRIINYKFTILGEVSRPGTYEVNGEKTTLLQAIGTAGDLTLFGQRENILIIREKENQKTYSYVDITKADFMNSEYYYVTQNDVIYIEPNKNARNQSGAGRNITILVSSLSLLLTLITFITR